MSDFPLDEVLRIQSEFAKLYCVTGLIGLSSDYVQVQVKILAELAEPTTWETRRVPSYKQVGYCYHSSAQVKGMKFLAVLDEKELAEYGLEIPGA